MILLAVIPHSIAVFSLSCFQLHWHSIVPKQNKLKNIPAIKQHKTHSLILLPVYYFVQHKAKPTFVLFSYNNNKRRQANSPKRNVNGMDVNYSHLNLKQNINLLFYLFDYSDKIAFLTYSLRLKVSVFYPFLFLKPSPFHYSK